LQEVTLACTRAVDVKVPNRPKTKPAMAIAAMRVMAMRITVANTGLIALRLLDGMILIVTNSYEPVAEKRAFPPFARITAPVTWLPTVAAWPATVQVTPLSDDPAVMVPPAPTAPV